MTLPLTPTSCSPPPARSASASTSTRPVPLELVKECLQIALQAPTGSNTQGWHWIVVTDPELRAADRRVLPAARSPPTARRGRRAGDRRRGAAAVQARSRARPTGSADHMGEVPCTSSAAIIAAAELPAENQAGLWGSLLPAAWSYQLAARARGLGSAWTTLHLTVREGDRRAARHPAAGAAGRAAAHRLLHRRDVPPGHREPLDQVLHLDHW